MFLRYLEGSQRLRLWRKEKKCRDCLCLLSGLGFFLEPFWGCFSFHFFRAFNIVFLVVGRLFFLSPAFKTNFKILK